MLGNKNVFLYFYKIEPSHLSIMKSEALFVLLLLALSIPAHAQRQVTIDPQSKVYEGGFFRVNLGLSPGSGNYTIDGYSLYSQAAVTPLYFDANFGKRVSRSLAFYFKMYGNVLLKETSYFSTFSQAGMGVGSNIYIKSSNYYIAPEISLAILDFYYYNSFDNFYVENDAGDLGVDITIKSGKDWHLFGSTFVGTQVFLTYYKTNYIEDETIVAGGTGFHYGVALSLKFGK